MRWHRNSRMSRVGMTLTLSTWLGACAVVPATSPPAADRVRSLPPRVSPSSSRIRLPVFQPQGRDSAELARVVRHKGQVVLKCDRGDLEVMRANPLTGPFKRPPDLSALPCAPVVEWQRRERSKKHVELRMSFRGIRAKFCAMAQFVHHDRAEPDVGDFHRLPASDERRPASGEAAKCRRSCQAGRSSERKPLLKIPL